MGNGNDWNTTKCSQTLAVMSIYDAEGVIDDYVVFYLDSLKKVVDRLIVAVNGKLTDEGEEKLSALTKEVYIRPNIGFDFGAYKDVLENYLQPEELCCYDELVLCNDTCYGPFVPFTEIFTQMRRTDAELWSINYVEDSLLPHFQSYFLNFRGETAIKLAMNFLREKVDAGNTELLQACGYEHGLSEVILSSNIKTDYYTSKVQGFHNLDIYGAPDYAMEILNYPMLKKKAFSKNLALQDNCRRALQIIAQRKNYPVSYILKNVARMYHRDFSYALCNKYQTEIKFFERNCVSTQDVIMFCKKHKKIYLYGNGLMSFQFLARFEQYIQDFVGYIVSDEYYSGSSYHDKKVYTLSQIADDASIVVALMKRSAMEVRGKLQGRSNILFLSIESE